jgi:hypothetical protein
LMPFKNLSRFLSLCVGPRAGATFSANATSPASASRPAPFDKGDQLSFAALSSYWDLLLGSFFIDVYSGDSFVEEAEDFVGDGVAVVGDFLYGDFFAFLSADQDGFIADEY